MNTSANARSSEAPTSTIAALSCSNLSKSFGPKVALNALTLDIPNQGVTAILGENGAGKTSLISCALGLHQPSSGEITLLGSPAGAPNTKKLVGVMLQNSDLPDLLSAREHIHLFQSYYDEPLSVEELCELCNLKSFIDTPYKGLSGGQKRCVQFALAILGQAKVVFLDEPTTGLDVAARQTVWATIKAISKQGTAVILTTHYLEEADALSDHIIVMKQGSIVAEGTTEKVKESAHGDLIYCSSTLDVSRLKQVKHIKSAKKNGKQLELKVDDASKALKLLFALDPSLSDLTIRKSNLEDAFLELSRAEHTEVKQDNSHGA